MTCRSLTCGCCVAACTSRSYAAYADMSTLLPATTRTLPLHRSLAHSLTRLQLLALTLFLHGQFVMRTWLSPRKLNVNMTHFSESTVGKWFHRQQIADSASNRHASATHQPQPVSVSHLASVDRPANRLKVDWMHGCTHVAIGCQLVTTQAHIISTLPDLCGPR